MRERKSACLTREMEHLSTEQLDEMLQKELQKEMPSEKVVLPILKELRQRETNRPMVDNTKPEIKKFARNIRQIRAKHPVQRNAHGSLRLQQWLRWLLWSFALFPLRGVLKVRWMCYTG